MKKLGKFVVLGCLLALGLAVIACSGGAGESPSGKTFTITFNANGGSGTAPAAQTVAAGSSINLPNEGGLTKGGSTFGGWNTSQSGTGTNYSVGSSYTPTASITLYARWITGYTVSFDINGGSGTAPAAQSIAAGSAVTLPSGSGLTKSGFFFGGWNTEDDGTGTNYSAGASYTPPGNITLYVKWNADGETTYTVTFNSNNGTAVNPITNITHGSTVGSPADPTKSGYSFGGWYREPELITQWNFAADTVTENITLYAKWNSDTGTEGLLFTLLYNNTYSVAKGTATASEVVVPSVYEGLPVAEIAVNGFSNYTNMTGITIPTSITTIGSYAFNNNANLTSITIPNSVTSVGSNMLSGCSSITSVTVPFITSTLSGAANGFVGYLFGALSYSGQNVYIPASLRSVIITNIYGVPNNAFNGCTGLTSIITPGGTGAPTGWSVTLPNSITSIGNNAFQGCTGLTDVTIPGNVMSIGSNAFNGCTSLTDITIDTDKVATTSSSNWGTIFPASNLSVTFKKNIGDYAFYFNSTDTRLASVTIAEGVTSIGGNAFYNCTGLTSITVDANNQHYASQDGILYNKTKTEILLVPRRISGTVTIPESVTSIGKLSLYLSDTNIPQKTGLSIGFLKNNDFFSFFSSQKGGKMPSFCPIPRFDLKNSQAFAYFEPIKVIYETFI